VEGGGRSCRLEGWCSIGWHSLDQFFHQKQLEDLDRIEDKTRMCLQERILAKAVRTDKTTKKSRGRDRSIQCTPRYIPASTAVAPEPRAGAGLRHSGGLGALWIQGTKTDAQDMLMRRAPTLYS
jgi:hypothetical protein